MAKKHSPIHPGAFLADLLSEFDLSQAQLAREIGVSPMRISHIVKGARPVTADIALDTIGKDALSAIHPIAA